MPDPFVPHVPEKTVVVEISEREAILVKKLRRYPYGKFTVTKFSNRITRLEINESQEIDPEKDDIDLS